MSDKKPKSRRPGCAECGYGPTHRIHKELPGYVVIIGGLRWQSHYYRPKKGWR